MDVKRFVHSFGRIFEPDFCDGSARKATADGDGSADAGRLSALAGRGAGAGHGRRRSDHGGGRLTAPRPGRLSRELPGRSVR